MNISLVRSLLVLKWKYVVLTLKTEKILACEITV